VADTLEIRLPELGDGQEEALLVRWLVRSGDPVAAETVVAVVETEKATVEVAAQVAGTLLDRLVSEGDSVPVGSVLAIIQPDVHRGAGDRGQPSLTARRLEQELGIDLRQMTEEGAVAPAMPDHSELRGHIETARRHLQQIRSRVHDDLNRAEEPLTQALQDLEMTLDALHRTEAELRTRRREVTALHEQQQETLKRYLELFAFAPDGYLVTDTESTIREINRAGMDLLHGEERDLVGLRLEDFIGPRYREPFRARLRALVEGRASRLQDWQLRVLPKTPPQVQPQDPRQDQPPAQPGPAGFAAELTVEPVLDASQRVEGLRWLVRDVTERRRAEEALHSSMARHRALLEAAVDGILTIDAQGTIQSANPAVETIFGYREEELLGKNVNVLMPSPDHERHDEYLARYHRTGEKRIIGSGREVMGLRRDGTIFPVDLAVSELRVGDRVGFVGILRDITERKAIEGELQRQRDFAESLVDTAQAIVLVLDPEGRIVRFNRYMESLTGYSLEELQGRDWFDALLPERDRDEIRRIYRASLEGEPVVGDVNPIVTRDGAEREIEWYDTTLRDAEGAVSGVLAVGLDVTERNRLEERFRQAQKMEAVGRLAGGVAHDFNTLLGSIIGYSELLLERMPEDSSFVQPVRQIHRGATRGAALTRQLLAFSRRQVIQRENLDFNGVVAGMEDMLRRLIGEDICFRQELDPELGPVRADSGQLEQVVMNLTVNAVDAMPTGGELTIRTHRGDHRRVKEACGVEVPEGRYALVVMEDTGHGFDEAVRHHIFEPFFTTKERGKGTGLGLSTVYGILQQSDGGISVESTPGKGTRFTIYLPEADGEVTSPKPMEPLPRPASGGAEVILLVEDDDMFLGLLEEVLGAAGYTVVTTADPTQAARLAAEHASPPQLLISDMVMPGMTGNQLARQMVEIYPDLPVLLMSGYTDEALEVRGGVTAGVHFIQKPFSTHRLTEVVRQILDGSDTLVIEAE
jgi:PAS domain S-box-containing protein